MQLAALLADITPGSIYPVAVGGDIAQVGIENDSPYDVWVSFGPQQPLAAPGLTTTALYNTVARSMATTYIPIPDLTPPFGGIVYLGVYDPSSLAQSGVVSSRAQLYITSLRTGEPPGAVFAVPRLADVTSQPRVIGLPIGLTHWASGLWNPNSGSAILQTFTLTALNLSSRCSTYYLYYAEIYPYTSVTGSVDVSIAAQFAQGSTLLGTPFVLARGVYYNFGASVGVMPFIFAPSNPIVYQVNFSVPAGADNLKTLLIQNAGLLVPGVYTVAANLDLTNIVPVADIGTAAPYNSSQARF